MRTPKHVSALAILVEAEKSSPLSCGDVENPVELLISKMNIGRVGALRYINELERLRAVVAERGSFIYSVRILKEELNPALHELEEETRLAGALWQHKTRSQVNPNVCIVHSLKFDLVRRSADLMKHDFYILLVKFEQNGWITYFRKSNKKTILYISLTADFPVPQHLQALLTAV